MAQNCTVQKVGKAYTFYYDDGSTDTIRKEKSETLLFSRSKSVGTPDIRTFRNMNLAFNSIMTKIATESLINEANRVLIHEIMADKK